MTIATSDNGMLRNPGNITIDSVEDKELQGELANRASAAYYLLGYSKLPSTSSPQKDQSPVKFLALTDNGLSQLQFGIAQVPDGKICSSPTLNQFLQLENPLDLPLIEKLIGKDRVAEIVRLTSAGALRYVQAKVLEQNINAGTYRPFDEYLSLYEGWEMNKMHMYPKSIMLMWMFGKLAFYAKNEGIGFYIMNVAPGGLVKPPFATSSFYLNGAWSTLNVIKRFFPVHEFPLNWSEEASNGIYKPYTLHHFPKLVVIDVRNINGIIARLLRFGGRAADLFLRKIAQEQ